MHRFEDDRLLRGEGRFLENLDPVDCLHAVFVRSPHAHAAIAGIDAGRARSMTGVRGVFTGPDFVEQGLRPMHCVRALDSSDGTPFHAPTRHVLATDSARFVGDPVAMVVADSAQAALDAAEQVEVDYAPLPAVLDPAASDDVAVVREVGDAQAVRDAFAAAAHVVRVRRCNNRISALPLETRSAIGRYDTASSGCRLETQTQGVHVMRAYVAAILGVDEERVHVLTPDVGGSFGMKLVPYPEQVAVLVAARLLGRPVRWVSSRSEALLTDTQARDHTSDAALALDKDGLILALRCVTHGDMGAYASPFATSSPVIGFPRTLVNVYRIPVLHVTARAAYTNTTPTDAFRGAGKPEGVHLMERLMDSAAKQLGIDRMSLRARNLVTPAEMPYRAANGEVWDCGDFPGVMRTALERADWSGFEARRTGSRARGRLRGFGLGLYLHTAGAATNETSRVEVAADGRVHVFVGQQAIGQGHETTFAQLVGEHLGVDPRRVVVVQGDSARLPPRGASTGGSASLQCSGTTLLRAADTVVQQLLPHAADALEASPGDVLYDAGSFAVAGTDLRIGLGELGARVQASAPADCGASADFEGNVVTIPNGAYVCEVEVDPDTGAVWLRRFVGVDDVGRRINPVVVAGQLHGGIVHGLGQAWMEHLRFDADTGQAVTGSLMDYAVPRADHLPALELHAADIPTRNNPVGAKGAGELGCLGAPAAFMNAVADAIGTQDIEMPATPERVWRALQAVTSAAEDRASCASTRVSSSGRAANSRRNGHGKDSTHCA